MTYTPPPKKSVEFTIGGEVIPVRELSWKTLEDDVLPLLDQLGGTANDKEKLQALRDRETALDTLIKANSPDTPQYETELVQNRAEQLKYLPRWYVSHGADVRILAAALRSTRPDLDLDTIRERLSLDEVRKVSQQMMELLSISGFRLASPVEADGSTATSTASSPSSSQEESPMSDIGNKSSSP